MTVITFPAILQWWNGLFVIAKYNSTEKYFLQLLCEIYNFLFVSIALIQNILFIFTKTYTDNSK